jgi:hypothetical protein
MSNKRTKKVISEQERSLDESLEDTFPASDPVSSQQMLIVGRAQGTPAASPAKGGPSSLRFAGGEETRPDRAAHILR